MMKKKNPHENYISPIFEHSLGANGRGMAGFTVHRDGEPFANHIRFYTQTDRSIFLAELNELRKQLLKDNKAKQTEHTKEKSL